MLPCPLFTQSMQKSNQKLEKISDLPQLDFVTITLIILLSLKNMKQQIVSQGGETNFSNPNRQYV